MVVAQHLHKTPWQRIYSLLGFWISTMGEIRTLYWMFLPWGPFYRKIDLFSWNVPMKTVPMIEYPSGYFEASATINLRLIAEHQFIQTGIEP